MDPIDPPPLAPEAPPRYGAAIQAAIVALIVVVCLAAVISGGSEAPDIVRGGGSFADGFEGDGPLGPAWEIPRGDFTAVGGAATVTSTAPDGAAIAVRRHGIRPRRITAILAGGGEGAGLVVGYRDPAEYWAVVASPAIGAWLIVHVQEGAVREQFTTEPAPTGSGTTIDVTVDAHDITVSIAGAPGATARSSDLLASSDGLIVLRGGAPGARWDAIEVAAP